MGLSDGWPSGLKEQAGAWVRLEPRCRSNDFSRGVQARTADPLWMLTRQWQTGEFEGQDTGSPLVVDLTHSTKAMDRVRLGESGPVIELPNVPLEMMVERERAEERERGELHWRARAQIGQQFERFARLALGPAAKGLISAYRGDPVLRLKLPEDERWTTDHATKRFIALMTGRVVDGQKLLSKIKSGDLRPPAESTVSQEQLDGVVAELLAWQQKRLAQPETPHSPAWRNQQLDYCFELNPVDQEEISSQTRLVAPDYRNGALDWYSFNMGGTLSAEEAGWSAQRTSRVHPTQISVGGTSPRWWAFEDSRVAFGKLDVAKPDLAKLVLMEFALIYGDDWFSVPLPVKMGNLVRIDHLWVTNVFGETLRVRSAREKVRKAIGDRGGEPAHPLLRWELFTLSPLRNTGSPNPLNPHPPTLGDALYVPPVAAFRMESPPLEEARFLRDEGSNMIFCVEKTVMNGVGRPVDGFDTQRERLERKTAGVEAEIAPLEEKKATGGLTEDEARRLDALRVQHAQLVLLRDGHKPTSGGVPRYLLYTPAPDNWIPFILTNAGHLPSLAFASIRLRRAQMLRNEGDEKPVDIRAMSRLLELSAEPLLWLEEATVPRSGLRLQLTVQRVRWVDGKTYVWAGRKVLTGMGEGSSGLRFDVLGE